MKVKVKNYQAIANAELTLEGLTVITGRSNIGKTALMRAIRAAFFGNPGDYYIREGEDYAGVALEDGTDKIVWRKVRTPSPAKQTALQVNGKTHTKLGRDHGKLTEELGVFELSVGGKALSPQFARQHDPIFLLTESDTAAAEVFKMLGRVDVITTAQAAAKRDLKSAESTLKVRETDREKALRLRDELAAVPGQRAAFNQLRKRTESLLQGLEEKQRARQKLLLLGTMAPRKVLNLPDYDPESLTKLRRMLIRLQELKPRNLPNQVPQVKALQAAADLRSKLQQYRKFQEAEILQEGERLQLEQEITQAEQEMRQKEQELSICPTCKRTFGEPGEHRHF